MNNNWHKKEKPLLGLTGLGGGVDGLAVVGAAAAKTYVDDVFSTYLYAETGTTVTVNNGVDMSEGGMVWFKNREATDSHALIDTARGGTKVIHSNTTAVESTQAGAITSFNTNGFEIGNYGTINGGSNKDVASWTFRKATGFFDVVKYSGTGSATTISHSLGCVPGLIIIKAIDGTIGWRVYHKATGASYALELQHDTGGYTSDIWNDTAPTATEFSLKTDDSVNNSTLEYVAYLFAGGASTAATARSVDFDGSGDVLMAPASSDYSFGSGDFTVEGWFKLVTTVSADGIIGVWDYSNGQRSWMLRQDSANNLEFYVSTDGASATMIEASGIAAGNWYHFAAVRTGNTLKLFLNGVEKASTSFSGTLYDGSLDPVYIGSQQGTNNADGAFSNIRITKGQALYTSSFRVPTSPLTTTSQGATASNVKLLCCNNSSVTGATVSSGTLTTSGDPTASIDSPFDDPAGFVFGGDSDQGIIKCGSYEGNNADDGTEVFVGFEPSLLLIKSVDTTDDWCIFDNLRGLNADGVDDVGLFANTNYAEGAGNYLAPTSTGFKLTTQSDRVNNGSTYIYMAIRGTDGYVGKPAEAGTDAFNVVLGAGNAVIPDFAANFAVNMGIVRQFANTQNFYIASRLTGNNYVQTNSDTSESSTASFVFDSNAGWNSNSNNTNISWMWKRGQGFDSVIWTGDDVAGRQIRHSLNAVPEMIWVKNRGSTEPWAVYHHGVNGGTTPWNYYGKLNMSSSFSSSPNMWNQTAPTSTDFTVIADNMVNGAPQTYVAYLFSSVEGISKCGRYTGDTSGLTVTTGFQPRFIIIRRTDTSSGWAMFDTVRGLTGTSNQMLYLNEDSTADTINAPTPTATGFSFSGNAAQINENTGVSNYIYYAHA